MFHCAEETLKRYGQDHLQETERTAVEDHLEQCDVCFELYVLHYLEGDEHLLPSESFTEDTAQKIVSQYSAFQPFQTKKDGKQTKTLLHYTAAAGFTLFLMMSGAFNYMTNSLDQDSLQYQSFVSEQVMEKTGSWLDRITLNKEDGTHE